MTATAATLVEARERAYAAAAEITWPGVQYRSRHRARRGDGPLVIPRYSLPDIADLFTDEARFGAWLEVEVLAVEAWARIGVIPEADARAIRERAGFDVDAINEREKVTDHDVAAFVDVVQERVGGPAGVWVHYGLTSSDVVDTALSLQLVRALDKIVGRGRPTRIRDHGARVRVPRHADGRAHPRHPRGADDVRHEARAVGDAGAARPRTVARGARDAIAVGKLSGAVGTY